MQALCGWLIDTAGNDHKSHKETTLRQLANLATTNLNTERAYKRLLATPPFEQFNGNTKWWMHRVVQSLKQIKLTFA